MADRTGNVILAPGTSQVTEVKPVEILYSMAGLFQKGVTLMDQGVLEAGTPLARDAATKKYRKATTTAEVRGFLRIGTDTSGHPKLGNIVRAGVVNTVNIALAGVTTDGTTPADFAALATALNGTYDAESGYLKF